MTRQEILQLIRNYIGVTPIGNLLDFTHNSLTEFYPLECGLEINASEYAGSKRERFEQILTASPPGAQARIIRGVLKKCPPKPGDLQRTQEAHEIYLEVARRLEGIGPVAPPKPKTTSAVVDRALDDTQAMIVRGEPTSCVDRVHTLVQGYLQAVCHDARIAFGEETPINVLFNHLRAQHPGFQKAGPRADDLNQVLRAMGSVLDRLNPIRNNASMAHPKDLLDKPEAMLVVNAARTILHYIDAKLAA